MLDCHEVENLYLQPEALAVFLQRAGRDPNDAVDIVRASADNFTGLSVVHHAAATFSTEHDVPKGAVSALSNLTFGQLRADWVSRRAASVATVDAVLAHRWEELLDAAWALYTTDVERLVKGDCAELAELL